MKGVGQVGLGGITVAHRAGYRAYGIPVVAGYDISDRALEAFVQEVPGARAYSSIEALLEDPTVEFIDLATPHHRSMRLPLIEKIAEWGKPVLIQKPLAMTYADALEVATVLQGGPTAMVNQNMCFAPGSLTVERALMVDHLIGQPSYGQLMMQYQFDTAYHSWFGRDERWWTVGLTVHHLGLLQLLFGPPATVYGMLGRDVSQPGVLHEGYGHLSLTYPDGLQVLIVSTGTYYGLREVRHGAEQGWLQGPLGLLDWSPKGPVIFSSRAAEGNILREELSVRAGTWFPDAFGLAMAHLQAAVAEGRAPLCSVNDNLYVSGTIEAAYRSASEHRVVEVQEIMGDRYDGTYGTGWRHGYNAWVLPAPLLVEDAVP